MDAGSQLRQIVKGRIQMGKGLCFWRTCLVPAFLVAILVCSCNRKQEVKPSGVLLSCGQQVVTVEDYRQLFDIAAAEDFPPGEKPDKRLLREMHLRLLQQLNDELVIKAYAADVGITIGDQELEQAVAKIKSDYPPGEFERVMLENAVPYEQWKKRLRTRLLMEKVIAQQLEAQVEITPKDVADYYRTYLKRHQPESDKEGSESDAKVDQRVIRHLRRQKAEAAYKQWLAHIHKKYRVKLEEKVWQRLIDEIDGQGT